MLIPMATSVAWGVALATVVTLLVVPASYVIREDIMARYGSRASDTERLSV